MEHKLSNLKHYRHLTLSDEERAYLRGRIAEAITRPQRTREPLFELGMQHGLRIALSSFLFVIFVGGSIFAVASNALPGDPLYSFKINVNEEIKGALLVTPEEKVAHQKNLVEKRVGEIKTLAESRTLTKERRAKAQEALDSNIEELSAELSALSEQSPNTALSVTANLEQSLQADKRAIQNAIVGSTDPAVSAATIEAIDGTLKKVSEQEVKIISKELEHISDELDATDTEVLDSIGGETDASASGEVEGAFTTSEEEAPTEEEATQIEP